MIHATGVNQIHPSKGYIAGDETPGDPLLSVEAMSFSELQSERDQLKIENNRWIAEKAAAAVSGDEIRARKIGHAMLSIQARMRLVGDEIRNRNRARGEEEHRYLIRLLRAEVGDDVFMRLAEQARTMVTLP